MEPNGTNKLVPFQPGALGSFVQNNSSTMMVYNGNGATITIPSDYKATEGKILVYNGPGSNFQIKNVSVNCAFCGTPFNNQTLLEQHNWAAFKRCSVHRMCFDNWSQHNKIYHHTVCGVQGCHRRGTDFHSNSRYIRHWEEDHNSHCKAEERRIGRGFCQPCYWQHAYSHDRNVFSCKGNGVDKQTSH